MRRLVKLLVLLLLLGMAATGVYLVHFSHGYQTPGTLQPRGQSRAVSQRVVPQEARLPQDQSQPGNQRNRIRSEVLTQATPATQTRHGTNSKVTSSSAGTCTLWLL